MSQSASVDTQRYLIVGHPERTGSETEVTEFHFKFAYFIRDVLPTDHVAWGLELFSATVFQLYQCMWMQTC